MLRAEATMPNELLAADEQAPVEATMLPAASAGAAREEPTCPLCKGTGPEDPKVAALHRDLRGQPDESLVHSDLGAVLTRLGRLGPALAHLRRAAELSPGAPGIHNNLGIALARAGRLDEAVAAYRHALRLKADFPQAHFNLGNILRRLGRPNAAAGHYEQALRYKPDDVETHCRLGCLRLDQGRAAEALPHLEALVRQRPESIAALNQLGIALTRLGEFARATDCFTRAVKLRPNTAGTYSNLGVALAKQGRLDEAAEHYRAALRLSPRSAGFLANLGNALRDQGRLEEAVDHYRQALRLNPRAADIHNNLAIAHIKLRQLDRALTHYNSAIVLQPGLFEARLNRAHAWLLSGDFRRGWAEYECRWWGQDAAPFRCEQPEWEGRPLDGRTILLHWEQGLGDTLQFVRYAPLVKRRGGTVVLLCQPRLLPLLSRCPGIDRVVPHGAPLPKFHTHASLMSLPRILGTTVDTIPAPVPYLFADPDLERRWRPELGPESAFKVGIAWQGNKKYGGDRHRSMPLKFFLPLARLWGTRMISLQKGPGSEQLRELSDSTGILDLGPRLDEGPGAFVDTAAVMKSLDLVITSDTSVVHLAGGLGVPVWVPLNTGSDWRWLIGREDSPWYPTMRLFRQKRRGDWAEVFERIAATLGPLAAEKSAQARG